MSDQQPSVRLWLLFAGPSGDGQVVAASRRAPRKGRRVEVHVTLNGTASEELWLLVRKVPRDVVLAVGADPAALEKRRLSLGALSEQYELVKVPVLESAPRA